MRFKLDENLGARVAGFLRESGHDVATVVEQALAGTSDEHLWQVCAAEGRALITLDLDFADPFRFDPRSAPGTAVLRLPKRPTPDDVAAVVEVLVDALRSHQIEGQLWIVQTSGVRGYQQRHEPDAETGP